MHPFLFILSIIAAGFVIVALTHISLLILSSCSERQRQRYVNDGHNKITGNPPENDTKSDQNVSRALDFTALIDTIKAEGRAYREEETREDHTGAIREWVTILVVAFTFVAVCWQVYEMVQVYEPIRQQAEAAAVAADAAIKQSASSEAALIQSQRAWVGPQNASLASEPMVGKPLEITITYNNYGHGPASGLVWSIEPFIMHAGEDAAAFAKMTNVMTECRERTMWPGGAIAYPGVGGFGASGYALYHRTADDFVTDEVSKGNDIIVVQGCFSYRTFDIPKRSYFCYFYRQGFTKIPNLNICLAGHDAN